MKKILSALVAASFAMSAQSETMIARQGSDWVRVTDAPCTNEKVLSHLAAGAGKQFRAATSGISGAPYAACWVPSGKMAFMVYEDGDKGLIPLAEFKEDLGA